MKAPSTGITKSLAGQTQGAGMPETPMVSGLRQGGPTMTVPGEGKVPHAPGWDRQNGEGRAARLASHYCAPMSRFGGSGD